MASSQVEMASSPYAPHVLRDYNRRSRDREIDINTRTRTAFKKNFKGLVRDHFQTCNVLSFPRDSCAGSDENYQHGFENRDCWISDDDRWAARQAREMITTLERQAREAELTQLSNSQTVSTRASTFQRESPPAPPDFSVDLPNLRASSLVQMWKEFEAESRSPTANQSGTANFRINPTTSNASVDSEFGESADERYGAPDQDSSTDWESDLTATSEHVSPSHGRNSDTSERVRVADIIRKLTSGSQTLGSVTSWSDENGHNQAIMAESSSLDHSISNQGGQRDLPFTGNTPRVRGRQAIIDLMKQMESERQREITSLRERHPVSRFAQRGRIQSFLRLRFLQQRDAIQDQCRPVSTASELNRLQRQTTIFLLRERFNQRVGQEGMAVQIRETNLSHTDLPTQTANSENPSISVQNSIQDSHHQVVAPLEQKTPMELHSMASPSGHLQEEAHGISDVAWQGTSSGVSGLDFQVPMDTAVTLCDRGDESSCVTWKGTSSGVDDLDFQGPVDTTVTLCDRGDESSYVTWQGTSSGVSDLDFQGHVDTAITLRDRESSYVRQGTSSGVSDLYLQEPVDTAVTLRDREDETAEETDLDTSQHVVGSVDSWEGLVVAEEPDSAEPTDISWISHDSDPQINWEGHRQAWFYEMNENNSDNEEIHELLGRRSVSNLLASGFRARMERLVLSYLQRQGHQDVESTGEGDSFEHQYHEVNEDYGHVASTSLQLPLPSQLRSWSQYQDHEVSDDSDHVPSMSLQRPQSEFYYQDSQQFSSFTNHSSLEMELIFDLRGHLASLHQEMAELRKSMESCMEMQVKLRNSIKQEVAAAVCHSIQGDAKEFFKQAPMQKGNCCICYDMKVDSLLYRCGHMCTCFNCANELQWSSSRCPICRAPILDVVRAYSDI